jgi:hypothetical protein
MKDLNRNFFSRILTVSIFAAAMGYLEAAVAVYLRRLYYPDGFIFPLRIPSEIAGIEIAREAATIIMLLTVAMLAGKRFWKRFGYFLILFGVWDIFYYIWLKVVIDWPAGILDTDVLFLVPLPWIGPVIAPVLVSLLMIIIGISLTHRLDTGIKFSPPLLSWIMGGAATLIILYSFITGSADLSKPVEPEDYNYPILFVGLIFYGISYMWALRKSEK